MAFFKKVEGEGAVVVERGIFKQVELYTRDGFLYAKAAGGFVKIMADGSTSKLGGNLKLDFMTWNGKLAKSKYGYLCSPEVEGARPLATEAQQKLLGASDGEA